MSESVVLWQRESQPHVLLLTAFCFLSVAFSSLPKVLCLPFSSLVLTSLRAVHSSGTSGSEHLLVHTELELSSALTFLEGPQAERDRGRSLLPEGFFLS